MLKAVIYPLLLFFLLFSGSSFGQNFYKERVSRNHIFSFGVGPSFAYLDNGGQYRALNFEITPSVSAAYTKKLSSRFDLRGTTGMQWISSGGNPNEEMLLFWKNNQSAYAALGSALYIDLMPSMNLIAFANHMNRSKVNLYGGFGIGFMFVNTKQTDSFNPNEIPINESVSTGYIPIRSGISFTLSPYSDIAGEGTIFFTFSDNLDGNEGYNRMNDVLAQAQLVYRRYFIPKPK